MDRELKTAAFPKRRRLHEARRAADETMEEVTSIEWEMIHMTDQEEDLIYKMINLIGHRWDLIAGRIPTRKPEEIERFVIMRERQGMMWRRE